MPCIYAKPRGGVNQLYYGTNYISLYLICSINTR